MFCRQADFSWSYCSLSGYRGRSGEEVDVASCPRCGHIAAAEGHALLGEWQDCFDRFQFEKQLAKWTAEWSSASASTASTPTASDRSLAVD